jgi:quercetin dioxygenase-like cupin family protein
MPVIHGADASVHELHGSRFTSYARPATGSTELCGWRLEIPGHAVGVAHQVSKEEVIYVLDGTISATVDTDRHDASAGDVIIVPANSRFQVNNLGSEPVRAWVTTSTGLVATLPDGSTVSPPWTR